MLEHSQGHSSERLLPHDKLPTGRTNLNPTLDPTQRKVSYAVERTRSLTAIAQAEAERHSREHMWDGTTPTDMLEAQIGRPMHHSDIHKRLLKLNPNLYFEEARTGKHFGIYLVDSKYSATQGKRYLFGMEKGYSPEFSVRRTDEKGELVGETRGWRTVLARLIRMQFIPVDATERAFAVHYGRSSKKWKELVHD